MSINRAVGLQQDIASVSAGVRLRRIGAAIVDLLIVSCIQIWVSSVFGVVNPASGYQTDGDGVPSFFSGLAAIHPVWLYVIVFGYFFVLEFVFSTTIGKFFFGLYVVDMRGMRVPLLGALVRNLLRFVDAFPLFYIVGGLSSFFSPTFQRLGDRVAHTTVVPMVLVPHAVHARAAFMWRYIPLLCAALLGVAFCLMYTYYERPPLTVAGWVNVNNVLVEDEIKVAQAGSQKLPAVPPCGSLHAYSGMSILGQRIQLASTGAARWQDANTISYTIHYTNKDIAHVSCSALLLLHWHGFLDGGWRVDHVQLLV